MKSRVSIVGAALGGALLAICLQQGFDALAAGPKDKGKTGKKAPPKVEPKEVPDETDEVPPPPKEMLQEDKKRTWESLEFQQTIPIEWGSVISINRVEKGGESYTFWFLGTDGTLRGVTTRQFTGPNRASFFDEVYVIRRK